MKLYLYLFTLLFVLTASFCKANARLGNKINENHKQYGKEISSVTYSETNKNFSGKKVYHFPAYGWQVEVLYRDGRSYSEVVRPKSNKLSKQILSEREANSIADILYPKNERGKYRKYVENANFLSHFFEFGIVSFEMQLDKRRKNHIGVIGVRTILYSNGNTFKNIKINAYH